jgi:hypothetical protein
MLTRLREAGTSQMDSTLVIMKLESLDLTAAAGVIDNSETWAEQARDERRRPRIVLARGGTASRGTR